MPDMYGVATQHRIDPAGVDGMRLSDCATGGVIVVAERVQNGWRVSSGSVVAFAQDRGAAITAMVDTALAVCPGDGYSTLVPSGLSDQP